MEIWVILFKFTSIYFKNDFNTCLILSFPTVFRSFHIYLNNFIFTQPQPHELAISETIQLHKPLPIWDLKLWPSLLETPRPFLPLSHHQSLYVKCLWLLEGVRFWGYPDHLLCPFSPSGINLMASHFNDVFALLSKSLILFAFNHSSVMNTSKRAFSSHILWLLKAAEGNNKNALIRSVKVLCMLISWTLAEPNTIKNTFFYSSCLHPINPPQLFQTFSFLKSLAEDFPYFIRKSF